MPIKSYIAIPKAGQQQKLQKSLESYEEVHVEPSENRDVIVLVTDTKSEKEDKELFNELKTLEEIQMITLVSAFSDSTKTS
jgi:nitrate reductase NapAB chaperone NapD